MTDPRVDRLERDVESVQKQINDLHSGSMQLVTTAFTQMEQRLSAKLDDLRESMVPMSEHVTLMARVDALYTRDLQGREDWERMVPQVRTLWDERTQRQGASAVWRWAVGIGGMVVIILTVANYLGFHPLR